jgi:hypothetical protein
MHASTVASRLHTRPCLPELCLWRLILVATDHATIKHPIQSLNIGDFQSFVTVFSHATSTTLGTVATSQTPDYYCWMEANGSHLKLLVVARTMPTKEVRAQLTRSRQPMRCGWHIETLEPPEEASHNLSLDLR